MKSSLSIRKLSLLLTWESMESTLKKQVDSIIIGFLSSPQTLNLDGTQSVWGIWLLSIRTESDFIHSLTNRIKSSTFTLNSRHTTALEFSLASTSPILRLKWLWAWLFHKSGSLCLTKKRSGTKRRLQRASAFLRSMVLTGSSASTKTKAQLQPMNLIEHLKYQPTCMPFVQDLINTSRTMILCTHLKGSSSESLLWKI